MKGFYYQPKRSTTGGAFEVISNYIWNLSLQIEIRKRRLANKRSTGFELVTSKCRGVHRGSEFFDDSAKLSRSSNLDGSVEAIA